MDFYNIMRDPGEKFGQLYTGLFAVTPIQITLRDHIRLIQMYPHGCQRLRLKAPNLRRTIDHGFRGLVWGSIP